MDRLSSSYLQGLKHKDVHLKEVTQTCTSKDKYGTERVIYYDTKTVNLAFNKNIENLNEIFSKIFEISKKISTISKELLASSSVIAPNANTFNETQNSSISGKDFLKQRSVNIKQKELVQLKDDLGLLKRILNDYPDNELNIQIENMFKELFKIDSNVKVDDIIEIVENILSSSSKPRVVRLEIYIKKLIEENVELLTDRLTKIKKMGLDSQKNFNEKNSELQILNWKIASGIEITEVERWRQERIQQEVNFHYDAICELTKEFNSLEIKLNVLEKLEKALFPITFGKVKVEYHTAEGIKSTVIEGEILGSKSITLQDRNKDILFRSDLSHEEDLYPVPLSSDKDVQYVSQHLAGKSVGLEDVDPLSVLRFAMFYNIPKLQKMIFRDLIPTDIKDLPLWIQYIEDIEQLECFTVNLNRVNDKLKALSADERKEVVTQTMNALFSRFGKNTHFYSLVLMPNISHFINSLGFDDIAVPFLDHFFALQEDGVLSSKEIAKLMKSLKHLPDELGALERSKNFDKFVGRCMSLYFHGTQEGKEIVKPLLKKLVNSNYEKGCGLWKDGGIIGEIAADQSIPIADVKEIYELDNTDSCLLMGLNSLIAANENIDEVSDRDFNLYKALLLISKTRENKVMINKEKILKFFLKLKKRNDYRDTFPNTLSENMTPLNQEETDRVSEMVYDLDQQILYKILLGDRYLQEQIGFLTLKSVLKLFNSRHAIVDFVPTKVFAKHWITSIIKEELKSTQPLELLQQMYQEAHNKGMSAKDYFGDEFLNEVLNHGKQIPIGAWIAPAQLNLPPIEESIKLVNLIVNAYGEASNQSRIMSKAEAQMIINLVNQLGSSNQSFQLDMGYFNIVTFLVNITLRNKALDPKILSKKLVESPGSKEEFKEYYNTILAAHLNKIDLRTILELILSGGYFKSMISYENIRELLHKVLISNPLLLQAICAESNLLVQYDKVGGVEIFFGKKFVETLVQNTDYVKQLLNNKVFKKNIANREVYNVAEIRKFFGETFVGHINVFNILYSPLKK